jgi:predicted MFS family arabinose efflux permease
MVLLFALSWGFIVMDRSTIVYLGPMLMQVFQINYAQIGAITMYQSFGFAVLSVLLAFVSDKTGYKKKWLIPFTLLAAIFSGLTAFASTLGMVIITRIMTGAAEGPALPLMSAMVACQGDPKRFAVNIGYIQLGTSLIAGVFAPIVITQLAAKISWQSAFLITALPALIVGLLIWKYTKEVDHEKIKQTSSGEAMKMKDFLQLLTYRNFILCVILNIISSMAFWAMMVYAPVYWVNVAGLSNEEMGYISAGFGLSGIVWCTLIPRVSDRIGRKPTAMLTSLLVAIPMVVMGFSHGIVSQILYVLIPCACAYLTIMFMTVINTESVPSYLAVSATAITIACGEFVGAAITPRILGSVADAYGLNTVFFVAAGFLVLTALISFGLIETKPQLSQVSAGKQLSGDGSC